MNETELTPKCMRTDCQEMRVKAMLYEDVLADRDKAYSFVFDMRAELKAERQRNAKLVAALKDAEFVLEGSVSIEGQPDAILNKRENALMRFLEALEENEIF